jgi:peptidoglycan hydrolase-like protein with peptidoglycan-binding domain
MPDADAMLDLRAERSAPKEASRPNPRVKAKPGKASRGPRLREELLQLLHGQSGFLRLLILRVWRRPLRSLAIFICLGLTTMILINAIALQSERHPAPFFAVAPATSILPAAMPLPPTRQQALALPLSDAEIAKQVQLTRDLQAELANHGFYIGAIDGRSNSRLDVAIREFEKASNLPVTGEISEKLLTQLAASKITMKDQLLLLIRASTPAAAPDKPATILLVQKALNKLGYGPVPTDGIFRDTTQKAIRDFERDRRLAVRGEPNGRLLKELSAASGIAIE